MAPDFGFVGLSSSILVEHIHVLVTSGDTSHNLASQEVVAQSTGNVTNYLL